MSRFFFGGGELLLVSSLPVRDGGIPEFFLVCLEKIKKYSNQESRQAAQRANNRIDPF